MHAEIQIGDSIVLLCDEFPEMGGKSPQAMEGSPVTLTLYVEDADATFNRASAGQGKGHDAAARHVLGRPLR
jgi:PhnB protein